MRIKIHTFLLEQPCFAQWVCCLKRILYYWNFQLLKNVIIIKKDYFPPGIGDLSQLSCLDPLVLLTPNTYN